MLNEKDFKQLEDKGITVRDIENQLAIFKKGIPFLKIEGPATPERGIIQLAKDQVEVYTKAYDQAAKALDILKFVPASGAASRMFKKLFEFVTADNPPADAEIQRFFDEIERFAFYDALRNSISNAGMDFDLLLKQKDYKIILEYLLLPKGLNYGELPKALLDFHKYDDHIRTALEEQLAEGALYAQSENKVVNLHLTVSPEHLEGFHKRIEAVKKRYESIFGVTYDISYSEQKPSTDTVAVTPENDPFRLSDDSILFRPGGHGALLENLNEVEADVIFIKNIDNVVPDPLKEQTITYKKALAGKLLEVQSRIFSYLLAIDSGNAHIGEMEDFLQTELMITFPDAYTEYSNEEKIKFLKKKLNRPVRVCGMVKNEGEPGGGPFFAKNPDGSVSLQIVESSQINLTDEGQKKIFDKSTHFNPVDLVVSTKDYKGNQFSLQDFRDPETAFISEKSKDGRDLKALELPGLWNGAMSDWNTLFVEVPVITFNPVKTVFDLLREQHQNA